MLVFLLPSFMAYVSREPYWSCQWFLPVKYTIDSVLDTIRHRFRIGHNTPSILFFSKSSNSKMYKIEIYLQWQTDSKSYLISDLLNSVIFSDLE